MPYIDGSELVHTAFVSQRCKRGRPSFGTRDPKLDRPLREAVRLFLDGKAKSHRDALMKVLSPDSRAFSDAYRRLNRRRSALLRAAARVKEIEDNDPCQRKIESFDPVLHKDAENGTYAFINHNSAAWEKAGVAGWALVQTFGDGEALIRRDLRRGILAQGSAEMNEFLRYCAAEFAQSGLFT